MEPTFRLMASTRHVIATRVIATSTIAAAGMPGTASRLIVRDMGSYPGVRRPATTTNNAAPGGKVIPTAP